MALLRAPAGLPLRFEVLRPDDLVFVQIDAHNLVLDTTEPDDPRLRLDAAAEPALLVITFQPQSITEKAYFETAANVVANPPPLPPSDPTGDPVDPAGSTPAIMAGPSRLVFKLPAAVTSIPFRSDALLDWSRFELVVSATADGHAAPPPLTPPTATETAVELPYRLVLSPPSGVGWVNANTPQTHAGRTELWHTRLGAVHGGPPSPATVLEASIENPVGLRAIWSPDFVDHGLIPGPGDIGPFLSAMSPRDRMQLVILTSGFGGYFTAGHATTGEVSVEPIRPRPVLPQAWVPEPVQASRLFLSALGGWLTSRGQWSDLPSYTATDGSTQRLDLDEWIHVATQARDHYVRIVYEGFLYPFGHRAALVKVTERKVVPAGGSVTGPTAYLKQHMYVVVREREKTYDPATFPNHGRELPFLSSVRIETAVTPDIDAPSYIDDGTAQAASFWIDVGGAGFPFHVVATDLAGSRIDLLAQLIFFDLNEQNLGAIAHEYVSEPSRRPCAVHGQKVAYADPSAGDTVLRTTSLQFDTAIPQPDPLAPPVPAAPFIPVLTQATVTVPALEQLLGLTTGTDIAFYSAYLSGGLDSHAGVFATLVSAAPDVTFTADKAGGLATPNVSPTALSARKGVVAGPVDDAAAGVINPAAFFGGVTIPGKLFGAVPLSDLIKLSPGLTTADASRNAPEIRTKLSPNAQHPQKSVTTVTWQPDVASYDQDPLKVTFHDAAALTLKTTIERDLQGGTPTSDITGELTQFTIDLLGVVGLTIDSLKFTSKSGGKPVVTAKLPDHPIAFEGPLAFVQTLATILPPGMFGGSGVAIKVTSTEITATLTLGLPSISIGVFSLEHISVMTGLDLPFIDGKPGFEFGFAKRSAPFLITVECLGGGGFVHLIVNADGVQMVEGALEFGGEFSLDVGVASGAVHIMAGIYFQLKGSDSDLTGFVDVGGEVSVLGIISVSIDLNLSLSWQTTGGKSRIDGKATLTVSVHVLFFSASVSISVERSFAANPGDPKVDQLISAGDWAAYAAAFA